LNLISIPVKAFSVSIAGGGRIGFNQIHAACNSRIHYKKFCPIHGEVTKDEIVPGYQVTKNQYIIIDRDKLEALRAINAEKTITIETFFNPNALDPIYYSERSYYLMPDGKVGQRPYAVIQQVMSDENRYGLASIILSGREQLVMVRPVGRLMVITVLHYDAQIKKPAAFEDELENGTIKPVELKLAKTLVESLVTDELNYAQYHDEYTQKIRKLIESKGPAKSVPGVHRVEEPAVINLMDALEQSVRVAKSVRGKNRKTKPGQRAHTVPRRRTG